MTISCIAAMSENGTIGRDNDIPWRLPSDLAHFKRTTIGHTIVMGRKTWESIGKKPLPRRKHVVITRQRDYAVPPGVEVASSWEEALERVRDDGEVFVVGGESVYEVALPVADRVYLTIVHAEIEGDVSFPDTDLADFRLVSEERCEADEANPYAHTFRVYERVREDRTISVVSGLPRSGTSMMMRMLEQGGMSVVTDGVREADADNPRGYYEFEKVKKIEEDVSWIPGTRGRVFKMVSLLLYHLPPDERYRIVLMRRNTDEILASERKMLERLGRDPDHASDDRMAEIFRKHLAHLEGWLARQPHMDVLQVSYNDVLSDPLPMLRRVSGFFGGRLDVDRMAAVVDPALYRQRKG